MIDFEKIIEKYFETQSTLSKDNFEMLREMRTLFMNEKPRGKPEQKPDEEEIKYCPKCDKVKPRTEFYVNRARTDGLQNYCKICLNSVTGEAHKKKYKLDKEKAMTVSKIPDKAILDKGEKLDKGKTITMQGSVNIYDKVLEAVKTESDNAIAVLERYYSFKSRASYDKYKWAYLKELGLVKPRGVRESSDSGSFDKGKTLHIYGNNKIHKNILDKIREAEKKGHSIKRALKKFYPKAKKGTISAYLSMYRRYLKEFENMTFKSGYKTTPKPHQTREAKLHNSIFVGGYGCRIYGDELEGILLAVNKVGFNHESTVDSIVEITGMKKYRVLAALAHLRHEKRVRRTLSATGKLIYQEI